MSDPDRLDEIVAEIDRRTKQLTSALVDFSLSRPMTPEKYVDLTYGHLSPAEFRAEYERLCAETDVHVPTELTPVSNDLFPIDDDDDPFELDEEVFAAMDSQPNPFPLAEPSGTAPGYMTADDYIRQRNRHCPPSARVKLLDPSMRPKPTVPRHDPDDDDPLDVCPLDYVVPLERDWVWPGYIPRGAVTLIGSAPGAGKSAITAALAAIISAGTPFPDGHSAEPSRILYIAPPYFGHMPLRARMDALGANPANIRMLNTGNEETLPLNFRKIRRYIEDHNIGVVVMDDITTLLNVGARSTDRHVRRACQPVVALAEKTGVGIIATLRTTELDLSKPGRRTILTASEWPAIARSVIAIGQAPISDAATSHPDPTGEAEVIDQGRAAGEQPSVPLPPASTATDRHPEPVEGSPGAAAPVETTDTQNQPIHALAVIKSNLSQIPSAVRWRFTSDGSVEWLGTFTIPPSITPTHPGRPPGEREEAKAFLQDLLRNGPVSLTTIMDQAKMLGIADITIRRAREDLGISSVQNEWRKWQWQLPPSHDSASTDSTPEKNAVHN